MSSITVTIESGIASVVFDMPQSAVNLLSTAVLEELEREITALRSNQDVKIALFKSAKDGIFIAGADIAEIDNLSDEEEARAKVSRGQNILTLITALPFPTVAIIDGACLGGGFELALACEYRITTQNSKTKIGLPEVSLGVIPGFGGTQRLKDLVGLSKALELILGSKQINGKKALKLGLVDACVPSGYLDFKISSFVEQVLDSKGAEKILAKRSSGSFLDNYLPSLVLYFARKEVLKKTKGHYRAPLDLIKLYRECADKSLEESLRLEVETFCKLAITPTCKNLISLFRTSEALKKERGASKSVKAIPIQKATVIGGGVMGSGIVWLFSKLDILVRLVDMDLKQIASAMRNVGNIYAQIKRRKRITTREIEIKMGYISYSTQLDGLSSCDLCIEAIVEDAKIKKSLYADIEKRVSSSCIIATNTSSISINELSSQLEHPERFVGMHFFNPVNRMPLVEIIAADRTSATTVATVVELAKKAGKTPIVVGDCAGFLVNRILIPYINESIKMFEEGEDIVRIDRLIEEFGMPMGPFTLADEVGLDVGYKVGSVLQDAYGERMLIPSVFDKIYNLNLLGKKSGKGFYIHDSKQRSVNGEVQDLVDIKTSFDDVEIVDRSILIMVNEAARCLDEGVVANASYLDMAMVLGTGFAPFRGGLMRYAQDRGLDNVVVTLTRLANAYGDRFAPCEALVKMAEDGRNYFEERV